MHLITKQRLTRVALALAVAGYCSIPSALAAGENNLKSSVTWVETGETGKIEGTVPWITRSASETAAGDKDHVTVSVDRGSRSATTDADRQLHVGDKVTINWAIGDTEGDLDDNNTATKATVVWTRSKNQNGSDAAEISGTTGSDSYTITEVDADYYIGVKMKPTTTTGTPNQDPNPDTVLRLVDLSADAGGGSDSDDLPTGPVVDESIKVGIYESGSTTNLIGGTTALKTNTTYTVRIWQEKGGNDTYDAGTDVDVTSKYDYMWKFTGTSLQLGTQGGDSSVQNQDLVIPVTNAEAKASIFPSAGNDGVQGYGLSIKYKRNDN